MLLPNPLLLLPNSSRFSFTTDSFRSFLLIASNHCADIEKGVVYLFWVFIYVMAVLASKRSVWFMVMNADTQWEL